MNVRNSVDFSDLPAAPRNRLETSGVTVQVAGKPLLHPTSAQFKAGEVTAIVGPNGAGKSTLMSVLTGQRKPDQGHVHLAGVGLQTTPAAQLARVRAFVAQESQVAFDFRVREVVELGRYPHRKHPSAQESAIPLLAMQATHVEHLADRPLNTLSGGEKARVHLARALAQVWEPVALGSAHECGGNGRNAGRASEARPAPSGGRELREASDRGGKLFQQGRRDRLCRTAGAAAPSGGRELREANDRGGDISRWLLLDEPTAALDLQHQHHLLGTVRRWATGQGVGVVVVLHDLNLALRYADRCLLLQAGQLLASGPCTEVLTTGRIAQVWGMRAVPLPAGPGAGPLQYVFAPTDAADKTLLNS